MYRYYTGSGLKRDLSASWNESIFWVAVDVGRCISILVSVAALQNKEQRINTTAAMITGSYCRLIATFQKLTIET